MFLLHFVKDYVHTSMTEIKDFIFKPPKLAVPKDLHFSQIYPEIIRASETYTYIDNTVLWKPFRIQHYDFVMDIEFSGWGKILK